MIYTSPLDIFVNANKGCIKEVQLQKGEVKRKIITKPGCKDVISLMRWEDEKEINILTATVNRQVEVYNTQEEAYSDCIECGIGSGSIVGLMKYKNGILTCTESGHIKLWKTNIKLDLNAKIKVQKEGCISRMIPVDLDSGIVALGGRNNDLQLWNLETKQTVFQAKNVKKVLELEQPIWITDIVAFPHTKYLIAVSTRYGQVRLYDTEAQKRPVINLQIPDEPLTTIALSSLKDQVLVGSVKGRLLGIEFQIVRREGKTAHYKKAEIARSYKGHVGSIKQIVCHPREPIVASVGRDRNLRIHNLHTGQQLYSIYLSTQLNGLLMRTNFERVKKDRFEADNEVKDDNKGKENGKTNRIDREGDENDEDMDELFNEMEEVEYEDDSKSDEEDDEPPSKKAKKKGDRKEKLKTKNSEKLREKFKS